MPYPKIPDFRKLTETLELYAQLKAEYGAPRIEPVLCEAEKALRVAAAKLKKLAPSILYGPKKNPTTCGRFAPCAQRVRAAEAAFKLDVYARRLEGALLGRMAGCTLGAAVEFWSIDRMKALAQETGV